MRGGMREGEMRMPCRAVPRWGWEETQKIACRHLYTCLYYYIVCTRLAIIYPGAAGILLYCIALMRCAMQTRGGWGGEKIGSRNKKTGGLISWPN